MKLARVPWQVCHGSDCFTNKGFSIARTSLPTAAQVEVDVYNLHMNAGSDPQDISARRDQARQLAQAILELSGSRVLIVAGDFNLSLQSKDPQRAQDDAEILDQLLRATGLVDAYGACDRQVDGCNRQEVDRILIRSAGAGDSQLALRALAWQALGAGTPFEGLSDHQAVVARIGWELLPGPP